MQRRVEAWREWKRRCALDLCDAETQDELKTFAHQRFVYFLQRFIWLSNLEHAAYVEVSEQEAWHLFETHTLLHRMRNRTVRKDWMFRCRRGRKRDLDAVQSSATLIMRDVVRDQLRLEFQSRRLISLSGRPDEGHLSADELLPGDLTPAGEAEHRDFRTLAREHAAELAGSLTTDERTTLRALGSGRTFTHPTVLRKAGRSKTTLHDAYRALAKRTWTHFCRKFADEDKDALFILTQFCLEELTQTVLQKKVPEKQPPDSFYGVTAASRRTD